MTALAASASEYDTTAAAQAGISEFLQVRAKYLLYQ
jgi:hypothetical protein